MYKREKVVSSSIILLIPLVILTERINAYKPKDFERDCRGSPLKNPPPDMCTKLNARAECERLCKASSKKTGFYRGECVVRSNVHYCHCYMFICAPPAPPMLPGKNGK
ncbi:Uncharacterized protein Rs2_18625 [Raphanus sativus]|nr:Uncharacterized protein Rs2_18625 [Raphanus sativus]